MLIIRPKLEIAFNPHTLYDLSMIYVSSCSVLQIINKYTLVDSSIRKHIFAVSFTATSFKLTLINTTVWPLHPTLPMHLVLIPHALISHAIFPLVASQSIHVSISPLTLVSISVRPNPYTESILQSVLITAHIHLTIWPAFIANSMLQVVYPLALIF